MKKRHIIILCFLMLSTSFILSANAETKFVWRNQADHSRWTNAMIFGNEYYAYAKPKDIRTAVELLNDALLLCIDQYNGSYIDKLKKLNDEHIPGIPSDISAIDFPAGSNHRTYTHRGWNYNYTQFELNRGHADIRKALLMAVTDYVFKFSNFTASEEAAKNKCDAMCCLLYVTHIIGDRYHSTQYYPASSTLLLAENNASAINDLENCLPTLLAETNCNTLIRRLNNISSEIQNKRHKAKTNEEFLEIDREYAPKVMKLLKESLYDLLIKQSWFSAVFNPMWSSN